MAAPSSLTSLPESLRDLPRWVEAGEGVAAVVASLQKGHAGTPGRPWNSSAPPAAAALGLRAPATLLIVLAHPRDLDAWGADLHFFSGLHPVVFPAWDEMPSADTVVDEIGGQRLRVLRALEGDHPPRLLLTTVQA